MKRLILLICMAMITLTACSTGNATERTSTNIVENKVFATADGKVELERKSILSDKVEILIPKGFTEMSEEMAKIKYPSERRPPLIFTNEDASINVIFNNTTSASSNISIAEYKKELKSGMTNLYPSAKWYSDSVEKINGETVGILELLSPGLDPQIYTLMFFMHLEGELLICSVNTTEKQMADWQPIAKEIMSSITLK